MDIIVAILVCFGILFVAFVCLLALGIYTGGVKVTDKNGNRIFYKEK
jgi:hypothetical protein